MVRAPRRNTFRTKLSGPPPEGPLPPQWVCAARHCGGPPEASDALAEEVEGAGAEDKGAKAARRGRALLVYEWPPLAGFSGDADRARQVCLPPPPSAHTLPEPASEASGAGRSWWRRWTRSGWRCTSTRGAAWGPRATPSHARRAPSARVSPASAPPCDPARTGAQRKPYEFRESQRRTSAPSPLPAHTHSAAAAGVRRRGGRRLGALEIPAALAELTADGPLDVVLIVRAAPRGCGFRVLMRVVFRAVLHSPRVVFRAVLHSPA